MSSNQLKLSLLNSFKRYLKLSEERRINDDLEGTLINLLLSSDNIYQLYKTDNLTDESLGEDPLEVKFMNKSFNIVNKETLEILLREMFSYISSYQEQLKDKVSSSQSSLDDPNKDDDENMCQKVKKGRVKIDTCKSDDCILF